MPGRRLSAGSPRAWADDVSPVTGERDGADIVAGPFVYQAKLRRGMPSYLRDWLQGIVGAAERQAGLCTGVVVWKAPHARDDDAVVVLRLKDWQALVVAHATRSGASGRSLGLESMGDVT